MKVLMVTNFFYPHVGGVEKHIQKISERLTEKGHQVKILTSRYDKNLSGADRVGSIEILRFPLYNIPKIQFFQYLFWFYAHREILKWADVVHFHDVYFPQIKMISKKPLFMTFHGYEGFPLKAKAINSRRKVQKEVLGSINVGHFIEKWYGTRPDIVVYGAVDLPKEKSETIEFDAVFIGRLEKDTGVEIYFRALNELNKKRKMRVAVCGDGSLRSELERFAKENALDTTFFGFVSDPGEFLSKGEIALVSGYLTILEAMIRKKPVIATYDNLLKKDYLEMIPDSKNNLLILDSNRDISEKIEGLLEKNEKREKMTTAAFEWSKQQTWEKLADTCLELYQSKGVKIDS